MVSTLLNDDRVRVNQVEEESGSSSLYLAAQNGHLGVVVQLLHRGADADQATRDGWCAIMVAASMVSILLCLR